MNKNRKLLLLGGPTGLGGTRRGQSTAEFAVAVPLLLLLLLAAADFGRIMYVSNAVNSAARAGAQYGSQTVITAADSTGMVSAATTDGSNISNLSAAAQQCTCESTSSVAACPASYCSNDPQATFVEVDTQATFHTLITWPGIPSSTIVSGKAIMQVEQ
jgi:Flp pilus assembly protein TadG